MKTKLPVAFLSIFAALFAPSAKAALTLVYSTSFNSPTYSDGALNTPSPTTDTTTPGQDGWVNTSSGGTGTIVNAISVANSATNGTVTLATSGQDIRRLFTPTSTAGSVYLAATITVASAQATGDYFIHLGDGGTSNFYARTYIKSATGGFVMAVGTSSGTAVTYGTTVLSINTPYNILIRYDFVGGAANDTGALFINPTSEDGSADTAYVAATNTGTDATTIGSVSLRQGSAANAASVTIDNLVVSIPEPTTALLGALGFISIFRRRR